MLRYAHRLKGLTCRASWAASPMVTPLLASTFHSSSVLSMGRKSGSKAMEFTVRPPSKKQMRKRRKLMEALALKRDPVKEKIRDQNIMNQIENMDVSSRVAELGQSIQEGILSLLDPNNKVFNRAGDLTAGVDLNATDDLEDKNYQPDKVIALLQQKKREVVSQQQAQIEDTDISKLPQAIAASTHKTDLSAQVDSEVSTDWANAALKQLSSKSIKYSRAKKLYSLMRDLNIPIETSNYVDLMSSATLMKMHIEADEYFDTFMKEDRVPSPALWTAKIRNVAKAGHIKQAIVLLDRLQKLSFPMEDAKMHNVVLQAMCDKRLYEDAKEFWIRMHSDGVTLDRESFHIAMAASAYQGEVERCFFYLDEMRANAILPDQESFVILIRACARAPYWVNGYQDSIYDAITALEGAEIIPDVDIYNEVIHAFAQAGDSLAAEYYFWEMRRKGISANVNTYIYLLDSYAKAQSIGAANYGWKGRYVRPAEELLTEEEEAMKALGPEKTARLLTSGMTSDVEVVKGKRMKSVLNDMFDEDPFARHAVMEQIQSEANLRRGIVDDDNDEVDETLIVSDHEGDEDLEEFDFEAEVQKDPALQALMKEVQAELKGNKAASSKDDNIDLDLIIGSKPTKKAAPSSSSSSKVVPAKKAVTVEDIKTISMVNALRNMETETFEDPFVTLDNLKGLRTQSLQAVTAEGEVNTALVQERMEEQISVLDLLDGSKGSSHAIDIRKQMDITWDMIEFGRLPAMDRDNLYNRLPLSNKRKMNKKRATLAFEALLENEELIVSSMKDITRLWNKYLAVHAEAVHVEDAIQVFEDMRTHHIAVNSETYEYLIRMHIRNKDLIAAQKSLEEMTQQFNLTPTAESYGLLIRAYTHRDEVVDALKTLEEAKGKGIQVAERNLTILRNRCEHLKIRHPDLSNDPKAWVKDVKKVRRNMKESSRRGIQPLQSAAWH